MSYHPNGTELNNGATVIHRFPTEDIQYLPPPGGPVCHRTRSPQQLEGLPVESRESQLFRDDGKKKSYPSDQRQIIDDMLKVTTEEDMKDSQISALKRRNIIWEADKQRLQDAMQQGARQQGARQQKGSWQRQLLEKKDVEYYQLENDKTCLQGVVQKLQDERRSDKERICQLEKIVEELRASSSPGSLQSVGSNLACSQELEGLHRLVDTLKHTVLEQRSLFHKLGFNSRTLASLHGHSNNTINTTTSTPRPLPPSSHVTLTTTITTAATTTASVSRQAGESSDRTATPPSSDSRCMLGSSSSSSVDPALQNENSRSMFYPPSFKLYSSVGGSREGRGTDTLPAYSVATATADVRTGSVLQQVSPLPGRFHEAVEDSEHRPEFVYHSSGHSNGDEGVLRRPGTFGGDGSNLATGVSRLRLAGGESQMEGQLLTSNICGPQSAALQQLKGVRLGVGAVGVGDNADCFLPTGNSVPAVLQRSSQSEVISRPPERSLGQVKSQSEKLGSSSAPQLVAWRSETPVAPPLHAARGEHDARWRPHGPLDAGPVQFPPHNLAPLSPAPRPPPRFQYEPETAGFGGGNNMNPPHPTPPPPPTGNVYANTSNEHHNILVASNPSMVAATGNEANSLTGGAAGRNNARTGTDSLSCPVCTESFSEDHVQDFQLHMFNCFDAENGPETLQPAGFEDSGPAHHNRLAETQEKTCPMCQQTFDMGVVSQEQFERHVNTHFGEEEFEVIGQQRQ